jgi:hypothetical protein
MFLLKPELKIKDWFKSKKKKKKNVCKYLQGSLKYWMTDKMGAGGSMRREQDPLLYLENEPQINTHVIDLKWKVVLHIHFCSDKRVILPEQ